MNKSYIELEQDKVLITSDNGKNKIINNNPNIEQILREENKLEYINEAIERDKCNIEVCNKYLEEAKKKEKGLFIYVPTAIISFIIFISGFLTTTVITPLYLGSAILFALNFLGTLEYINDYTNFNSLKKKLSISYRIDLEEKQNIETRLKELSNYKEKEQSDNKEQQYSFKFNPINVLNEDDIRSMEYILETKFNKEYNKTKTKKKNIK